MTSKLSVNNAYFCNTFVIIMQPFLQDKVSAFFLNFSKDRSKKMLAMRTLS